MNTVKDVRVRLLLMVKVRAPREPGHRHMSRASCRSQVRRPHVNWVETHRNIWHNHENKQWLPPDLVTQPQGKM